MASARAGSMGRKQDRRAGRPEARPPIRGVARTSSSHQNGARKVRTTLRAENPPLVGRMRELKQLEAMLESARHGRGGLALIAGEAGAGKSYLAARLGDEARRQGHWVFPGHCRDSEGGRPYGPYVDILEAA